MNTRARERREQWTEMLVGLGTVAVVLIVAAAIRAQQRSCVPPVMPQSGCAVSPAAEVS